MDDEQVMSGEDAFAGVCSGNLVKGGKGGVERDDVGTGSGGGGAGGGGLGIDREDCKSVGGD